MRKRTLRPCCYQHIGTAGVALTDGGRRSGATKLAGRLHRQPPDSRDPVWAAGWSRAKRRDGKRGGRNRTAVRQRGSTTVAGLHGGGGGAGDGRSFAALPPDNSRFSPEQGK